VTRVLAFTGGRRVPSARFRVGQYVTPLERLGVHVDVSAATLGSYPPRNRLARPAWAIASVLSRVPGVLLSRSYDVSLHQREMLSTFQTLERFTGRPRILDVDDALWLLPRGRNAGALAARCDRVIAGNGFLADYFREHCADVEVLPTAVDSDRFTPRGPRSALDQVVIGWSGTSGGEHALVAIVPTLATLCRMYPGVRLRILSDRRPHLEGFPAERLDFVPWSPQIEAETLRSFDIGIMPLTDGPWERGKCSYKMLLYMASGVPVVVSPVGMNVEVLSRGEVGRSATGPRQWLDALVELIESPATRAVLGQEGRQVVEQHYSVRVLAPRLALMLSGAHG
jgi:glycosyltransferase involved in cell wall biosynthesis